MSATFAKSFPQPDDVENGSSEEEAEDETETETEDGSEVNTTVERGTTSEEADITPAPDHNKVSRWPDRCNMRPLSPRGKASNTNESFVTASDQHRSKLRVTSDGSKMRSTRASSFVTASETPQGRLKQDQSPIEEEDEEQDLNARPQIQQSPTRSSAESQNRTSNGPLDQDDATGSKTRLLAANTKQDDISRVNGPAFEQQSSSHRFRTGLVKFNLNDDAAAEEQRALDRTVSKIGQAGRQRIWRRLRRGTAHPGEIIKMEKMLVRVDSTMHQLPKDFNENDSLEIEVRAVDKWREYIVVCRESTIEECDFSLQLYKTRVIPARAETHVQKPSTHEIPLSPKSTRANLYSSLDKTLVIWVPWKRGSTMIYILRPRSSSSAVEWHTFVRNILGWHRSSSLDVYVPDLNVTLKLQNPFTELEESMDVAKSTPDDDMALRRTMEAEKAITHTIIQRSLAMLEKNPEWAEVLSAWLSKERIGLAWKRYDRLEWVHGANEQRMYGSMAMQRTHELELRPKEHYPTEVRRKKEITKEPSPVEGFLIRLTSQKGNARRLGKMYFKRLYFVTHNQYMCYMRPPKALPPPPPEPSLKNAATAPSTEEILKGTPLIFAIKPYPDDNDDGEVDWLQYGSAETKERRDLEAFKESERQVNTMLGAEGFVNLEHVTCVQSFKRGDSHVDEGSDVDFHQEVTDTTRDDGKTRIVDDRRTFELVMNNGLTIRLQAYNEATKKEWVQRLQELVRYWKMRLADDMTLLKAVRDQNLKRHDIDEEMEAYLGQFGEKWEVTRSVASPKIFHMCGISCCRAITVCF